MATWLGAVAGLVLAAATQAQTVPPDPMVFPDALTPTEFNLWFQTGSPSLNGVVSPANSITFSGLPNGSFYKWSEQMFLWLTSPAPAFYGGGGGHIFDSSTFFDVSPEDANGHRKFIPLTPGVPRRLGLRAAQLDAHGLPVLFSKSGQRLELQPAIPVVGGKLQIHNTSGELVEVEKAIQAPKGKLTLFDKTGKEIEPRPSLLAAPKIPSAPVNVGEPIPVQKIIVGNIPVFVDPQGNVVEVEQGQAQDGSVLEAQNGSLIYYAITVNDVYAYYRTQLGGTSVPDGTKLFPTTQQDLTAITTFAAQHGKTFPDPTALAIEIKSSWIEAASLPNPQDYITMTATIPVYTKTKEAWTPTGEKTTLLAMVGMHVVGSTAGHPEMLWATFEHVGNTPTAQYAYLNTAGNSITIPQTTAGNWLFSKSNSQGPFNIPTMSINPPFPPPTPTPPPGTIFPATTGEFTASDTIRWKVWGAASDVSPNPIDASPAMSNSEIILMNNRVRGMLTAGDVRGNYLFTGCTWTVGGTSPSLSDLSNQVGTNELANSTMETYQQGPGTTSSQSNCFQCHNSPTVPSTQNATTDVSHIFSILQPLF